MNINLYIVKYMNQTQGGVMNIMTERPARDVYPSMMVIFRQRAFVVFAVMRSNQFDMLHLELIHNLFDRYVIYSIFMFKQAKVVKREKGFDGYKLVNQALKLMQKDNELLRLHYEKHNAGPDFIKRIEEMINIVKENHK